MTQLIVILIVLFVSGAVIAAMGDRLGTYIGKKRLSGFGLRPKHTAMLYTMLFGGLIAVLTWLALFLFNTQFHQALIEGPKLIQRNSELQKQMLSGRRELDAIQIQLNEANSLEQAALQREKDAEGQRAIAEADLGQSKQTLTHTQLVLEHRQALLTRQEALLATSLQGLKQAKQDLSSAQQTLGLARQGLLNENESLAMATATVHAQEKRVNDLEKRSSNLLSNIQLLFNQNQLLELEHDKLVQQPMIYYKGQELGRAVMSTNQSYSDIRNQVVAFLDQLSQNALLLHGKVGKNDRAIIMLPSDVSDQDQYQPDNLTEDLTIDSLAHSIQDAENQADSVVLVATAHINSFSGDQIQAKVVMYRNALVYQKGTLICSSTIDGSQSENDIFNALKNVLVKSVRPLAMQHGIIPVLGPNHELSVGGQTGTDSPQTLALVKEIQSIGVGAVLSVYAASDTYSNGPLRIRMSATAPAPSAPPVVAPHPAPTTTPSPIKLAHKRGEQQLP